MSNSLEGIKTEKIYAVLDPGGSLLGKPQVGKVEYVETEDRIKITVHGDPGSHVVIIHSEYTDGRSETIFTSTNSGGWSASLIVDGGSVLSATREALGPQSPPKPEYKLGDYSLR